MNKLENGKSYHFVTSLGGFDGQIVNKGRFTFSILTSGRIEFIHYHAVYSFHHIWNAA